MRRVVKLLGVALAAAALLGTDIATGQAAAPPAGNQPAASANTPAQTQAPAGEARRPQNTPAQAQAPAEGARRPQNTPAQAQTQTPAGEARRPQNTPAQAQTQTPAGEARRPLIQVRRPPILPVPETEVRTDEPGAGPLLAEENQTPLLQWNGVRVSGGPVVIQFPDLTTNDGTEEVPTPGLLIRMPWTVP